MTRDDLQSRAEQIVRIASQPGIKRDGTMFEGDNYVDGQWTRFQRGLPRKMPGYRSINKYLKSLPRTLHGYTRDSLTTIHAGSADRVETFTLDTGYNTSVVSDRTPGALTASDYNMWQFDTETSASVAGLQLVAQVAPNLDCLCNSAGGQLFYGSLFGTAALTQVVAFPAGYNASGGILALHPYTLAFGTNGYVMWTPDCTDYTVAGAGAANITGQKLIRGLPLRGGPGASPSGLLWSADSLMRATYVGGTPVFQFDTISSETSILGAQTPIEYDGVFYWIGSDRFLKFNGVVQEVENNLNINFFFDGLNYTHRQKVFAFKVPRFGEIWWCFPKDDSTEPNHAVIYNVRENTWYDTALPNGGRGAGISPAIFPKPLLSGVEPQDLQASSATVGAGGAGYAVGNVLKIVGGIYTVRAEFTVATVAAGAVTSVTVSNTGHYTSTPANPAATTGGAGAGATLNVTYVRPYKMWVHEIGTDEVDGNDIAPIQSYFETADISLPLLTGDNNWLSVVVLEPDFVQSGDLTVRVKGRANARSREVEGPVMTIPETVIEPEDAVVFFKEQRRQLRFRFESNTLGGDYQMGLVLAHVRPADGTILQ